VVKQIAALEDFPSRMELEGTGAMTVNQVIDRLSEQMNRNLRAELMNAEASEVSLKEHVVILVNGYHIEAQEGLETVVPDGSEMLISVRLFGG